MIFSANRKEDISEKSIVFVVLSIVFPYYYYTKLKGNCKCMPHNSDFVKFVIVIIRIKKSNYDGKKDSGRNFSKVEVYLMQFWEKYQNHEFI